MVESSMVMPMGVNTDRTQRRQVVFYNKNFLKELLL